MADLRVRGVDEEIVDSLKRLAEANGRSLESELRYRLEEFGRARLAEFPSAANWLRAGFDDVEEVIPGYQYIAHAAGLRSFRIALTRSMTGQEPEWNTEIEESVDIDGRSCWVRAIDVAQRLNGATPAEALRDCIRWLAEYAGVDTISRARRSANRYMDLPTHFKHVVDSLDEIIDGSEREIKERNMVIWRTKRHEIYVNIVDDTRLAVMVYPAGGKWSVTDGKAAYFPIESKDVAAIHHELKRLSVVKK